MSQYRRLIYSSVKRGGNKIRLIDAASSGYERIHYLERESKQPMLPIVMSIVYSITLLREDKFSTFQFIALDFNRAKLLSKVVYSGFTTVRYF